MGSDIRARAEEVVGRSVDPNRVRVGLIMPFYNEAASLAETLASIAAQTFDHRRIYLIAVDGASTDGGAAVIQRWFAQSDIGGIVANNPQRRIPISLNIGIRQLDVEDLVVRLDAHTTYGPTYIADIVAAFAAGPADLGCVGGGQLPEPGGSFQTRVSGVLLTHPLGVARLGVLKITKPQFSDSIYLGAWRPGLVQLLGGFEERWIANEDSEFASRLRAGGWRMLLIPVVNRYRVTRGIWSTIKQWAGYGFWRAQTIRRYPVEWRWRHAVVLLGLFVLAAIIISPWRLYLLPAYVIYALAVIVLGARQATFGVNLCACVVFPVIHVAYAANFLRGLALPPSRFVRSVSL
jgi:glycosyltransferase involved in cell wall biosynthesis